MMDENRLDNIVKCAYNMDNGYVEVWYVDGNMLRIKCEEVEAALRTTEQSLAKLHKLLDNKPIEYVAMALSGEMQAYCDIEDEMVKGMFGTIVQGYLPNGHACSGSRYRNRWSRHLLVWLLREIRASLPVP